MEILTQRVAPGVRLTSLPDEHARGGEPLDLDGRVLSFTFEDSERRADKITLQLDNFDLSLFDREELVGGAVCQASWGYPGLMAPPRRVVLQKLKGFTTLTLEGRATSVLMDKRVRSRAWASKTRAQVARSIAEEHGYQAGALDVDSGGEILDSINQAAETDARFLRRLAVAEGLEFYIDDAGFHFHRRRQGTAPTHVFTWYADPGRGDVLSISVEGDLSRRVGRVTVKGRDPLTRATIEHTASNANVERGALGEVLEVVDPDTGETSLQARNATASLRSSPASTPEQIKGEASARFRAAERGTIKLSMRVVGDPTLHAKSVVEVRGVSALLSGRYYATSVKHTISSAGYVCDLKLTRDGSGRRARPMAQETQGQPNLAPAESQATAGAMTEIEVIDPDSGAAHIEYRRDRQPLGAGDPEGRER